MTRSLILLAALLAAAPASAVKVTANTAQTADVVADIVGQAIAPSAVTTTGDLVVGGQVVVIGTSTVKGSAFGVGGGTFTVIAGAVGLGDVTPDAQLEVQAIANSNYGSVLLVSSQNATTIFEARNDGLVSVGTGTIVSTASLHVNGAGLFEGSLTQKLLRSCTTGTQTDADGKFSACVASDARLKRDVEDASLLPGGIDGLRAVSYRWKDTKARDDREHLGFIAQEVERVYPTAVVSAGQNVKGIDSNALIAVLVEEVKALRKRVRTLEKRR